MPFWGKAQPFARSLRAGLALAAGMALLAGCATPPPAQTASRENSRVISMYWATDFGVNKSRIDFLGRTESGARYRATLIRSDLACDVRYSLRWHNVGTWALWCDSGRTASGKFRALGDGKGSFGWGEDDLGNPVRYVVHASDGSMETRLETWLVGTPPISH